MIVRLASRSLPSLIVEFAVLPPVQFQPHLELARSIAAPAVPSSAQPQRRDSQPGFKISFEGCSSIRAFHFITFYTDRPVVERF